MHPHTSLLLVKSVLLFYLGIQVMFVLCFNLHTMWLSVVNLESIQHSKSFTAMTQNHLSFSKLTLLTLSKLILAVSWVFSQCLSFTVVMSSPHEVAPHYHLCPAFWCLFIALCCYLCRSFENCSSVRTAKTCLVCLKSFTWQVFSWVPFLYLEQSYSWEFPLATAIFCIPQDPSSNNSRCPYKVAHLRF